MADVQKENGYMSIANVIGEQLSTIKLSANESQILWAIFRKTYGWNKKSDRIALTQFCELTKLNKPVVARTLKRLSDRNFIIRTDNKKGYVYEFQKDFEKWKIISSDNKKPLSKLITNVINSDNKSLSVLSTTKDTITKYTTKDTRPAYFTDEILEIYKHGISKGFNDTKEKPNAWAIHALIRKKFTKEQLIKAINYSQEIRNEPFAPQINNFLDLEDKILKLRDFAIRSKRNNQKIITI